MKIKHTPGPWKVDYEGPCRLAIVAQDGTMLAFTNLAHEDGDLDEFNARLIAAAPELLEACKQLYIHMPSTCIVPGDDCEKCHLMDLIAKAEGR